ncbi:related to C4-dicarboxylate transport protein [Phialocephala subalpina]|uniref:Related to C4-dicarboxylate transport protein n=1 Tax=Phialocephala subalpina TaxID=576137 RepID=A0A1L7WH92_9HELO|nr:related to C4-dicarboxylate transport protein [Phialocephala subalpina]
MVYPQTPRPAAYGNKPNDILEREVVYGKDIEVQSISIEHEKHEEVTGKLSIRDRLKHFTFAWYASTTSTGGVAFVLSVIPNRFGGLTALGTAIFIFNLLLFTCVTITMCARFILHPGTFTHSLTNPHEGFFFATFWLTIATIISNTTAYGIPNSGPWLIVALRIAFWIYTVCATLLAIFYYHVLFTVKKLVLTNVLPGWVLPVFPAMLVGTLASAIAKTQPPEHAMSILAAGLTYQGLGIMVAIMMYSLYFGRLLTSGLPADMSRPAMFIAVGPPSFTALAFIGMAQGVTAAGIFSGYATLNGIVNQDIITDILSLLALIAAIFLWTLAFWFFAIAVVASIEAVQRNDFHLNWYAYVFPNVGFAISAIKIGDRLSSPKIQMVGTGMAAVLFLLWILIVVCHIKAVVTRKICWPGKDEDAH